MPIDDELALIKKKKLEELMKRRQDILTQKPPVVIEVFTSDCVKTTRQDRMFYKIG